MKKIIAVLLSLVLCCLALPAALADGGAEQGGYVLMNIPYAAFYEAEVTDASALDAVSSATLMKPRAGALAGGSYHVDPAGSDVTGVTFPVYAEDLSVLPGLGGVEITDDSSVTITVTLKGEESTETYTGKDALFEAPSYSWYVLSEEPAAYKTLNADGSFGALRADAETLEGSASFIFESHADMAIKVNDAKGVLEDRSVSGVILTADDGTRLGVRHLANLWRKTQIGFKLDSELYRALAGKRITEIAYITADGVYTLNTDLAVSDDELLPLLNGTYIELFPEFAREEYKDYWMECIKAYLDDDEAAEMVYAYLTQGFMGRLKGQEAVDAFGADPTTMVFDCFFENGLAKFTVNGDEISGFDADGKELFRHTYAPVGTLPVVFFGEKTGTYLHIYKADAKDAGLFTYFAFADDTLGETYHTEFRYGEHLEDLADYSAGEYAYWLAAGINDGYKEKQIKACIKLFVDENVGGEEEEKNSAVEIATAEDLAAVRNDLAGNYILTADIDLGGVEWTPIGSFVPLGMEGEEAETPDPAYAFTGSFNGQGHSIRNFVIDQPEGYALGLFGCVSDAVVGGFTVENARVYGTTMAAAVVGYSHASLVYGVTLRDAVVTGHATEISGEGMYGGVVGAAMASLIDSCDAEASVTVPDNSANAGIVGGGLEMTDVVNCRASGSVSAGNNCYGLGGISGCGFAATEFTGNTAEHVTITAGDGCFWIGGITGYAGGFEDESMGMPVTVFTDCHTDDVTIVTASDAEGVGPVVGAGFFMEGLAEAYGVEAYANPTVFVLVDSDGSATLNGEALA